MAEYEKRRGNPYIWPTWLTGVLSGDDHCQYAPWWMAHHKTFRVDDEEADQRLQRWKAEHADLVKERAEQLRAEGWTVTVEDQNKIHISGNSTVGAAPDIIALKGRQLLISDAKGGKKRGKDAWQVRIYQFLVPLSQTPQWKGREIVGEVYYGLERGVDLVTFTDADMTRILSQIRGTGSERAPESTPSKRECQFCKAVGCKDRWVPGDGEHAGSAQGLF